MLQGRIVDVETVLEPNETSRPPDPILSEIPKEIRSMPEEFVIVNERLDKLEDQQRTRHRDTNKHAYTDMFCASAVHERYGSRRPAVIITLRAELSTVRQEEGVNMDTFGDRVYNLTNQAYPFLLNAPSLLE